MPGPGAGHRGFTSPSKIPGDSLEGGGQSACVDGAADTRVHRSAQLHLESSRVGFWAVLPQADSLPNQVRR